MTLPTRKILINYFGQWWILGEANEAVASGPPFFGGPPLDFKGPPRKPAYTVLDSLSGRFGVKTFFFFLENTLILGEKYPSPDQTSFFSQTT